MSEDMIPRAEANAMVAAALTEAAEEMEAMRGPTDVPRTDTAVVFDEAADRCIEIVHALIDSLPAQRASAKLSKSAGHSFHPLGSADQVDALPNAPHSPARAQTPKRKPRH